MIDLERNKKKRRPVEAKGKRTKDTSIYRPNQIEDFKIRSSIREKLGDKKGSDEDLNQVKKFNKEIK